MKAKLIHFLQQAGSRLQVAGAPYKRYRAFDEAAHFLSHIEGDVENLALTGRLYKVLPVKGEVKRAIEDILAGREPKIAAEFSNSMSELSSLDGVPRRYLEKINRQLKIYALKDLEDAYHTGELDGLDWLPPPIVKRIGRSLLPQEKPKRWTLGETLPIARKLMGGLRGMVASSLFSMTGRLRRSTEWVDGIFILGGPPEEEELHRAFRELPGCTEVNRVGKQVSRGWAEGGIPVELRTCTKEAFVHLLQYHTGSPEHSKQLRRLAKAKGYSLRQDRLNYEGKRLRLEREKELYERLGLQFIPPEIRRGRGEIELAQGGSLPNLVKACHIEGDFHVHSDFSDGFSDLRQLALEAEAASHSFIAICDHSRSLTCARGLTVERLEKKRAIIDKMNGEKRSVHIFCGAEVDILPDGRLDYDNNILSKLDVVIAAVHQKLNCPPAQLTSRMVEAIDNPHVHILAHASTRILGMRPARNFDVDAVLNRCKERRVALEVNGHAHRMDPPLPIIERAIELGVPLALGSDAHHTSQMWMVELALSQARRAGASPKNVINTWPMEQLREWLKK